MRDDHHAAPFSTLVEILSSRYVDLDHIALVGEMIKATADLNIFLASTKAKMRDGKVSREVWLDLADRFESGEASYENAWRDFKSTIDDTSVVQPGSQYLIDALRGSLDVMRSVIADAKRYQASL